MAESSDSDSNQWSSSPQSAKKELDVRQQHIDHYHEPPPPPVDTNHLTRHPNTWSRYRYVFIYPFILEHPKKYNREYIREPFAEFLGVMILIIFGAGVDCQVVLSTNTGVAPSPKGVSVIFQLWWSTDV